MAAVTSPNEMECVELSSIKSDLDGFTNAWDKPAKCILDASKTDSCKYYYKDSTGAEKLINSDFCECSLMQVDEKKTGPVI